MKGHVLGVDSDTGVIAGEDGGRYTFAAAAWRGGTGPPAPGMPVDFVPAGAAADEVYPEPGVDFEPPVEGTPSDGRLFGRLKSLIVQPKVEFQAIAAEAIPTRRLIGHTALLAGAAGMIVGLQVALFFGLILATAPDQKTGQPLPLAAALGVAAGAFVFLTLIVLLSGLLRVLVEAAIAKLCAPSFGGTGRYNDALKLVTYASAPLWLALMVPFVGLFLQWVGWAYSIYLLHSGAGPVLKVPRDRRVGFTALTVVGTGFASMVLGFAVYFLLVFGMAAVMVAVGVGAAAAGAH